jgi:8-oxo-dGTP pyrophosphatase MutT (NUDIX family)
LKPYTSLPAAAPPQPTAVVAVLLSTDWPDLAPRGPVRVLATGNVAWPAHQLSLPGGKVEPRDGSAVYAVMREVQEETGLYDPLLTAVATPVWEGWQAGPVAHYVRAYLVTPAPGAMPVGPLKPEQGNRLVWIEPDRLALVCPYEANTLAIEAALYHANRGGLQ